MRSVGGVCVAFFSSSAGSVAGIASAMRVRQCAMTCFAVLAILTSRGSAVVILNSDGTVDNNQTTAAGTPAPYSTNATTAPYSNVGVRAGGGASVIYLGNDWAITASHVALTGAYDYVQLAGQNYTIGFTRALDNSDGTTPCDLTLIHLLGDPNVNLPSVTIPAANSAYAPKDLVANQSVTMVGAGMDLGTSETDHGEPAYSLTSSEDVTRWGTNVINIGTVGYPNTLVPLQNNPAEAYTFTTTFASSPSATNQEAQATLGDSGGGVFENFGGTQSGDTWIGGTWYLVGMMDGFVLPYPVSAENDPSSDYYNNVYVNEESSIIDLPAYSSIIAAGMVVAPEPSGLVLGGLGAGIALLAGLHARRQRLAKMSLALATQPC
jgi:hypothetical protein